MVRMRISLFSKIDSKSWLILTNFCPSCQLCWQWRDFLIVVKIFGLSFLFLLTKTLKLCNVVLFTVPLFLRCNLSPVKTGKFLLKFKIIVIVTMFCVSGGLGNAECGKLESWDESIKGTRKNNSNKSSILYRKYCDIK